MLLSVAYLHMQGKGSLCCAVDSRNRGRYNAWSYRFPLTTMAVIWGNTLCPARRSLKRREIHYDR